MPSFRTKKYLLYNVRLGSALVQYKAGRAQTLRWNALVILKVHTRNCKWPMHRFAYNTPYLAHSHNCGKLLLTSSCLSVCPSAWNNSARTERFFIKFGIGLFFENLSRRFNRVLYTEDLCTFMAISCRILLGMRNISDKFAKTIKTHTLRSIIVIMPFLK